MKKRALVPEPLSQPDSGGLRLEGLPARVETKAELITIFLIAWLFMSATKRLVPSVVIPVGFVIREHGAEPV